LIIVVSIVPLMINRLLPYGLKPVDALHVACAIELNCDYFLTVDKSILKKATDISAIKIKNPIDFIIEWEAKP
jgi:predicted nucleic acid-binding protein